MCLALSVHCCKNTLQPTQNRLPPYQVSCLLPDGTLMGLENVSCMCAKLIYLAKVSVLELVMEREERLRMAAMDEFKPLMEINNYNIFLFLCRVQGLARRVFCTSNRIPMILSRIDEVDRGRCQHQCRTLAEMLSTCIIQVPGSHEHVTDGTETNFALHHI